MIRSDLGVSEVMKILLEEQQKKKWVSELQRAKFPQSTEPLETLVKDSKALQKKLQAECLIIGRKLLVFRGRGLEISRFGTSMRLKIEIPTI